MFSLQDQFMAALTAWRENRGGGVVGMQSIINVLMNRVRKYGTNLYHEATRFEQFSSITTKGDPQLNNWPADTDPQWLNALSLAAAAASGSLTDITGGADLYYAPKCLVKPSSIELPDGSVHPFPNDWNHNVCTYTATIAGQLFFKD